MKVTPPITVGLVVLTTGTRPEYLAAIAAAAAELPFDERVLVGNGCELQEFPGWTTVETGTNLGVPGGRSFGMRNTSTDVVLFLDDDSSIPERSRDLVAEIRAVFDADPRIAALALRVVIEGTDETLRRWSPTPTKTAGRRLADVPTFPGNGHALRREAFDDVGGYLDALFFKHEETELSWRLLDAGWRVVTSPHIVVEHPDTPEGRHAYAIELGLRNKIWISRLRLPLAVAAVGCVISTARAVAKCRSADDLRAVQKGLRAGVAKLPQARSPISWATVVQLARAGRPPIF